MCISSVTRVFAALLLATAVACGGEEIAPPPGEPVPAAAQLVVELVQPDPTGRADFTIDFGSLDLGKQGAAAFVLRNVGDAAVEIAPVQLEAPFSIRLDGEREIEAGGALSVVIRFTPTAPGTFESIMLLQAGEQTFAVRLRGSALSGPEPVCVLAVDDRRMHWGGTGVGYRHAQDVALANLGDAPCSVDLFVEGPDFDVQRAQIQVAPGSVEHATVTWSPQTVTSAKGSLHVASESAEWQIALTAESVASCLRLEAEAIDFGTTAPRCSTVLREVVVANGCPHPAALHYLEVDAGMSTEFGVRRRPVFPAQIPPGGRETMELIYVPDDRGHDEGRFFLGESNGTRVEGTVSGRAELTQGNQTDRFDQPTLPRRDTLIVVDDSPAMQPWADDLAAWAASSRSALQANFVNANWGVTTTSRLETGSCPGSGADGRLLPLTTPRWLTVQDTEEAWRASLDVGTCSAAPNEGISAAWRALSELADVIDDPAHPEPDDGNAGFLRPEAQLHVIFVSVGDDASVESIDTWVERFDSIKGTHNDHMLTMHAVVAPEGGCASAQHGERYLELAERTGGLRISLCEPSTWSMASEHGAAWPGFGFQSRFFLSDYPADFDADGEILDDLSVTIDGIAVPPVSAGGDWTYNADVNSIDFAAGRVPPEGSDIEITYTSSCLPFGP